MGLAAVWRERGRSKTRKTYFLKNITIFFAEWKFILTFANECGLYASAEVPA
jgi:hypothetical protein